MGQGLRPRWRSLPTFQQSSHGPLAEAFDLVDQAAHGLAMLSSTWRYTLWDGSDLGYSFDEFVVNEQLAGGLAEPGWRLFERKRLPVEIHVPPWVRGYQRSITTWCYGRSQRVHLVHEPDNPHDPNALAIVGSWRPRGRRFARRRYATLGYVKREIAAELHQLRQRDGTSFRMTWVAAWPRLRDQTASICFVIQTTRTRHKLPRRRYRRRGRRPSGPITLLKITCSRQEGLRVQIGGRSEGSSEYLDIKW